MIGFDNAATREDRWKADKFTAFPEVLEMFNNHCAKNYTPDDFHAIDETLYPTCGRVILKIYNKDKPAKYGLKFRSLGSSRKAYVYYKIPYGCKSKEISDSYIGDTFTLVKRIVDGYERNDYSLRGTNISMDRYYTSIQNI